MHLHPQLYASADRQGVVVEIVPPQAPIVGTCFVPGSKSLTNRALLLAGFAQGRSELTGLLDSEDAHWGRDLLQRLGIVTMRMGATEDVFVVQGCQGQPKASEAVLHLGNAGTLARFLPGLLAAAPQGVWQLTGTPQLQKRPLAPLVLALGQMGGRLRAAAEGGLPLMVTGGGLRAGTVRLPGDVSSQFVSGVLMAAAASKQAFDVHIEGALVQPAYVEMTVNYLREFGAAVAHSPGTSSWHVAASTLKGRRLCIEADASTACYFWGLAAATGGTVTLANVGAQSMQADVGFLLFLEQMGCNIEQTATTTQVTGPVQLRGGFTADLTHISDQAPTLAALASLANGPVHITGVGHIRHHESDRISAIAGALRAVGALVETHDAGLSITPQALHKAEIDPQDDHRIAMAMALVAVKTPGLRIHNSGCVAKTCPRFFQMLEALGVTVVRSEGPYA